MRVVSSIVEDYNSHILVVDDEPINREIIEVYLEDEGYELSFAGDGAEALEVLNSPDNTIDILLLDLMMPIMTGLELLKSIQKDSVLKNIPVILQTARASKEDIKEGIDAGAYFYLTKPFDEDVLLSMVASAVMERQKTVRLQQELAEGITSLSMMNHAHFQFRTLEEAHSLSMYLAKSCPEPQKIVFGLSELFINAIEHGNVGISYTEKSTLNKRGAWRDEVNRRLALPENKDKFVDVTFDRNEKDITIVISDKGEGFDWGKYMVFSPDRVFDNHGRGIASSNMMSMDHLQYNDKGNEVTAIILLKEEMVEAEFEVEEVAIA